MDHMISTAWGGRKRRYAQFPGAVSRCHDPYDGNSPVEFAKPIEYEAWVRERFAPDTLRITHSARWLSAWDGRKTVTARPTFVVTARNLVQTYHLVVKRKPVAGLGRLRALAACTGARLRVTLADELRGDMNLFWRLEFLRAASQQHSGEGEALDAVILDSVRAGCANRSALQELLHGSDAQLLDARLGQLHCGGLLLLGFESDDFSIALRQQEVA